MDYLTLLATRSLVFFPHHQPLPTSSNPSSPNPNYNNNYGSPNTTPEVTHHFLPPDPVHIPLQSLAWADRECALFLLNHILVSSLPSYKSNPAFSASPGTTSMMEKRMVAEAEGMVWKEVEKGKQFVRVIGEWYATSGGGMRDDTLRTLAAKSGVVIKEPGVGEQRYELKKDGGGLATHSVREVVMA